MIRAKNQLEFELNCVKLFLAVSRTFKDQKSIKKDHIPQLKDMFELQVSVAVQRQKRDSATSVPRQFAVLPRHFPAAPRQCAAVPPQCESTSRHI
jgi:hypothetical protein